MVPEQAIHEGILRLHHCLTSTEHSSGVEECYEGEHCELCAAVPELLYMFAYLEGSGVGHELEEKIKFYKSASYSSHRRVGVNG